MHRMATVFVLAVGVSLGVSFLLWGQPSSDEMVKTESPEVNALQAEVAALRARVDELTLKQSDLSNSYADFEILLARLDMLDKQVRDLSLAGLAVGDPADPEVRDALARAAEEKARQVYQDMKDEEQRKREEEWRKRQEERWQETQDWLTNVYNERLALLTKELSLTPNQEACVRDALSARREEVLKIYAGWNNQDQGSEDTRPSWDNINQAFDTAMKQLLDQSQYKSYKDKHLDDFNRGRGGGR
jgi:hypothetical protein